MKVSVFVGISVDGFIARTNGDFDFLPTDGGVPNGYEEFMATVDSLVIGRHTFDVVRKFGEWPYGTKPLVILSSRPLPDTDSMPASVEWMSGDPAEIVSVLEARGIAHIYVDGGITIQRFLRSNLITSIIITRVPVLIGEGIPLFGALQHDVLLRHVHTKQLAGGLVQSEYALG
ncbi:MAG: dihydrofolate reductase family protein [Acidobacteriota bacterium]